MSILGLFSPTVVLRKPRCDIPGLNGRHLNHKATVLLFWDFKIYFKKFVDMLFKYAATLFVLSSAFTSGLCLFLKLMSILSIHLLSM